MLVINSEQVNSLVKRLGQPDDSSCLEEVRRMLDIKSTLLWRAEAACGCVGTSPAQGLYMEVQALESVIDALERGDIDQAKSLLEQYSNIVGWRHVS